MSKVTLGTVYTEGYNVGHIASFTSALPVCRLINACACKPCPVRMQWKKHGIPAKGVLTSYDFCDCIAHVANADQACFLSCCRGAGCLTTLVCRQRRGAAYSNQKQVATCLIFKHIRYVLPVMEGQDALGLGRSVGGLNGTV